MPKRRSFLLTWNPAIYTLDQFRNQLAKVRNGELDDRWSAGSRRELPPGSRLYLMRLGLEPKGIVGFGLSTGPIEQDEHYIPERAEEGKEANYAPLRWVHLQEEPLVPLHVLEDRWPRTKWTPMGSGIELYDANAIAFLENVLEGETPSEQQAWALYSSQDGERSFQGNEGYEDRLGEYLSYDNQVANSMQVKKGDRVLILDGELIYGTSVVDRIKSWPDKKSMMVCPECETTTLYPRKRIPGFRCTSCKKVWDAPKTITKDVTAYRAFYGPEWAPFVPQLSREVFPIPFANKAVQNAIRPLHADQLGRLLGKPTDVESIERDLAEIMGKPTRGGGFAPGLTAAQRKAVEDRAMQISRETLERDHWVVEDKSANHPYDFLARKGKVEMHVEVKGTTTLGERVVLTRGEVRHHSETPAISALCLVTGISIGGSREAPEASGGALRVICPWTIEVTRLDPLAFEYQVPPEGGKG